jgi:hypothetical protein
MIRKLTNEKTLKIMKSNRVVYHAMAAVALVFGTSASLSAQIITSAFVSSTTSAQNVDLTGVGTTDWVQFGVNDGTAAFGLANEKSGGSSLDTVGAVSLSGSPDSLSGRTEDTQNTSVSYTNGTSPASSATSVTDADYSPSVTGPAGTFAIQTGFNSSASNPHNPEIGSTLSFTIDFNQAISSGTVTVAGNSFAATDAKFTAILSNGNTKILDPGVASGASTIDANDQSDIFTLNLSNITAGSHLDLSFTLAGGSGFAGDLYDNVSLSGVALQLTEAPEPSTYAMMLAGVAVLFGFLRFRRQTLL